MNSVKYIGMDVHKEGISIAVLNSSGKLVMECVIETKASTILQFIKGLARDCVRGWYEWLRLPSGPYQQRHIRYCFAKGCAAIAPAL